MKVAKYYNNSDIRLLDIPVPKIDDGEILVKVLSSGICGTDIMEWYRIKKGPRILGHEIIAEIVETRSSKYKTGQIVFVSHHVPCNECKYCLRGDHTACETLHKGNYDPGGYAEYVRVPKINVDFGIYPLPSNITHDEGTLIEPLACVVRAQRLMHIQKNETVLILGCGVSGLLHIQLAKARGANIIATDIDDFRLSKAKEFGAQTYYPQKLPEIKADHVVLCTSALSAVKQAFDSIDKKGHLVLFAIPNTDFEIPVEFFWRNEITMLSSYGAAPVDLEESIELIKNGTIPLKGYITHALPLTKIQEGFNVVASAKESLKVVLNP